MLSCHVIVEVVCFSQSWFGEDIFGSVRSESLFTMVLGFAVVSSTVTIVSLSSCPLRRTSLIVLGQTLSLHSPAHEQVLVGLAIFGAHHDIDDGVYASGQVDQDVTGNVKNAVVDVAPKGFSNRDW